MKTLLPSLILMMLTMACTTNVRGSEEKADKQSDTITPPDTTANTQNQTTSPTPSTLTIALTGDIMPGTTFPTERLTPDDGKQLFRDVRDILTNADIALGNLEGALCDTGTTVKKASSFNYAFRIPTRYGALLRDAGYDFLSVANNHSFDFGMPGVRSTEATLRECGIAWAGISGRTEATVVTRNGVRYGICAFGHNSYTPSHSDYARAKATLQNLSHRSDIVIVSFHGGAEGTSYRHLPDSMETFLKEKRGHLRRFAHFCIDNGADVVYGHGPHVPRCVELYKGRFIAYSLGNFCTPYGINISGVSGYAPLISVETDSKGQFQKGTIHSFIQKYGIGPRRDATNAVSKEIRSLTLSDIPQSQLSISADGRMTVTTPQTGDNNSPQSR